MVCSEFSFNDYELYLTKRGQKTMKKDRRNEQVLTGCIEMSTVNSL